MDNRHEERVELVAPYRVFFYEKVRSNNPNPKDSCTSEPGRRDLQEFLQDSSVEF